MRKDREPHIGEYAAKTNAVCGRPQMPQRRLSSRRRAFRGHDRDASAVLLPVIFQHLIARRGQLGAILLQASEDGEVALIDHGAAVALNVAGASLLLLRRAAALLLGNGAGGNRYRQQEEREGEFTHRIPSFSTAENPIPE